MKIAFINCFANSNEMRIEPIREYFEMAGHETKYFTSDFDHSKKNYYKAKDDSIQVHVPKYKKNLSIRRLLSHYYFSKEVFLKIEEYSPDILYVKFPPNSLCKFAYKYARKNKAKVILDIFDLWPESMPVSNIKKKAMSILGIPWARMRNKYLKKFDYVFTECDMYREVLKRYILKEKSSTLYICRPNIEKIYRTEIDLKTINLFYLGQINNLIDISIISTLISELSKHKDIVLHIIGDGEKIIEFISKSEDSGAKVINHGRIYDDKRKNEIASKCHFALNIMKPNIKVALTLKSIEYLRMGLPLISNIDYDTWEMVESNQIGFNLKENYKEIANNICLIEKESWNNYSNNCQNLFKVKFSNQACYKSLDKVMNKILDEN